MNIEFIKKAYYILQEDNICFIYQGDFTDEMTSHIIDVSEYNMDNKDDLKKLRKKVSFLMAESFQNIVRHGIKTSDEKNNGSRSSLFLTRSFESFYYITSANLVENKHVSSLAEKLRKVNELDPNELKALYQQILSTGDFSEKGGAGLGFIEMARKSGKKIDYEFEPLDEKYSMFYMRLKMQGCETDEKYFPLVIAKDFYTTMRSGNIMMIYKGEFSRNSILPTLKIIEENLDKTSSSQGHKKRVYITLVEMMQNISKHGYEPESLKSGMITIGAKDGKYSITSANPVAKEKWFHFDELLKKLKSMDRQSIMKEYKTILKHGKATEKGGAGLGLLDIVRSCSGNFEYCFDSINEKSDLFIFSVTL